MMYLAENLILTISLLRVDYIKKSGLIGKLIKFFIMGLFFMFLTWLLFGEALHPKALLYLPIVALRRASGG